MGISLPTVQVVLRFWKDGYFAGKKSVLELGSQELHLPFKDFQDAVFAYGHPNYDEADFMPWEWENRGKCCFADKFYSLLGFTEYKCFDMNGENNAIAHDLNTPFEDRAHFGRYDLVTDFGCAEHVFNVSEVYNTMHKTCKTGGFLFFASRCTIRTATTSLIPLFTRIWPLPTVMRFFFPRSWSLRRVQ